MHKANCNAYLQLGVYVLGTVCFYYYANIAFCTHGLDPMLWTRMPYQDPIAEPQELHGA